MDGVPALVSHCVATVEERGLNTVGVYRVPGNKATINALTEILNKGWEHVDLEVRNWIISDCPVLTSKDGWISETARGATLSFSLSVGPALERGERDIEYVEAFLP